ncbi:MAG: KEOPS complex subunit Cgi121 [Candidatus Diapherotrites archaeon]
MIKKLNESFFLVFSFGKLTINSFRANIKSVLLSEKALFSQIINLKPVASPDQVMFASLSTVNSIQFNSMHLSNPSLELLLHLCGERQINKALDLLEVKEKTKEIVLIVVGKEKTKINSELKKLEKLTGLIKDEKLIQKNFEKNKNELMKLYGIKEKELKLFKHKNNALKELIIEKNAMMVFE